jgi:hypothetical protein
MFAIIFKSHEDYEEGRKNASDVGAHVAYKEGTISIKPMITMQMSLW